LVSLIAIVILSYLMGSFPTGIVFGRAFRGIDVREYGSKTMGATNVMRVLGPRLAIPVLAIDMLKGVIAVIIISKINLGDLAMPEHWLKIIAGFVAIGGHVFPVWVHFKGGKGIGTAAGVMIALFPLELGFALLIFALTVALTRYVSLGSILATLFLFCALLAEKFYLGLPIPDIYLVMVFMLLIIVLLTHRQNISRLVKGQENKFGNK
jgi:glycerol-3-phosphate acyltransferase PlsY